VTDADGNVAQDSLWLDITGGEPGSGGSGAGGSGAGGAGGAGSADPATDDFERATLGSDWNVVFPASGSQVRIVGNSDLGMAAGPQGFFIVEWAGSEFSADQFSEVTLPEDVDPDWLHQPFVRRRDSDNARYGFGYDGDPSQVNYGDWYFKYDGVPTVDTRMIETAPADVVPGPGDVLRVEVEGFTLRGYYNGDLVLETTDQDAGRIADGRPGIAARWAAGNGATPETVRVVESWSGGSL
jgi:hypothetical protein